MAVAKKILALWVCSASVLYGEVFAQTDYDKTRGELLYSIHCISCHDTEIHWRAQKRVTDWRTLKEQVNRWQNNLSLDWNGDDVSDVAVYLNAVYYHFPATLKNGLSENDQPLTDTAR